MATKVTRVKGKTKTVYLPVTTSTAFDPNTLVTFSSNLIAAVADNGTDIIGVIGKTVATTDGDYATSRKVPVIVPVEKNVIWKIAYTGTAPTVGTEYGVSNAYTIDTADTTNKVFRVTRVDSTNGYAYGVIKFNGSY
jgi:hypothetical protein